MPSATRSTKRCMFLFFFSLMISVVNGLRQGLPLTKALAPQLVDFGESSSIKPLKNTVIKFASPDEIEQAFRTAGIPIQLSDQHAHTDAELILACQTALEYSVKTRHPLFLNQLYGGVDDAGTVPT